MKTCFLLALLLPAALQAQTISGTQLEIGQVGSNQVTDNPLRISGAIGIQNSVSAPYSLAIGNSNQVYSSTPPFETGNSLAVGQGNNVRPRSCAVIGDFNTASSMFTSIGRSILIGYRNVSGGDCCGTIGMWNTVYGSDYDGDGASTSLTVGSYNHAAGASSLIVGENNEITGQDFEQIFYVVTGTSVLGHGLVSKWSSALVIGSYNDTSAVPGSGLLFAIGNGADATHRSNALEVYASGKITMPRQGDVLMGEFGHTGD